MWESSFSQRWLWSLWLFGGVSCEWNPWPLMTSRGPNRDSPEGHREREWGGHRGEKEKELWMESWGKVKGQPGSSVPTTWWRACTLCKRASSLTPTAQTIITACIFNAQVYHSCAFITEIKRRLTLPAYTACIDCVICYDCLQNSAFQMYRQTLHCHHLL